METEKKEANIIKKIVIDIDGKEISLTPEQSQKLLTALTDLLSVKKEIIKEKEYVPYPIYPYYPPYHYRPYWKYDDNVFVWGTASNDTVDVYRKTSGDNKHYCSATFASNTAKITL